MKRLTWVMASVVIGCAFSVACGDDDDPSDSAGGAAGMDGGVGGAGGTSVAGSAGMAGSAGSASGGAAGSVSDAGDAEAGNDAAACLTSYALGYCGLTSDPKKTSTFIVVPYLGKVKNDCRVAKLIKPQTFDFANKLTAFTFALWGCPGHEPAAIFGLVDGITALSAADASVLIDYYVELTVSALTLPPSQEAKLRAALECLAAGAITNPSTTEHELSICGADAGADAAVDSGSEAGTDAASDAPSDVQADVMDGGTD